MTKHRILSIDGGGIRGALTSCFLVELERQIGKPCREIFDFVAGTSTGALIVSAICAGLPAERILAIYRDRIHEIFPFGGTIAWAGRISRGYAYDPGSVCRVMQSEFGKYGAAAWKLNDCPIGILLTAKHVSRHPWYFVKDNPRNAGITGGLGLIDCAVASASAPTYFAPWYVNPTSGHLIGWCYDGGVGVTGNPVYQACVEAFYYDDFSPTDTQVISLGTGFHASTDVNPPQGFLPTLSWTLDASISAPEDQQTELVDRHWPGIMQRFNWELGQDIDMADASQIPGLITVGQKLAAEMDWKTILK